MERMTYVQLNVRLAPELAEEIEEIAQEEKLARTDVVRQLLSEGAERWKLIMERAGLESEAVLNN